MQRPDLIAALAEELLVNQEEIGRIIVSAPYRYKVYSIPKRSGGVRVIHHPTPELKVIQR